jgi:hypothetical protein
MNPIPNIAKRKANTTCSEGIYPRWAAKRPRFFKLKRGDCCAADRG